MKRTMWTKFITYCFGLICLAGCSSSSDPEIRTVCLRDAIGNYIIKWETIPSLAGTVRIFESDVPDQFDETEPVLQAPIDRGVSTFITNDNITRKYFKLVFNNRYSQVIGARTMAMDSVQNLRDLGGYLNKNRQSIRWGRLFRSGQLSTLSEWDADRLDRLNLKCILDLRTESEQQRDPIRYTHAPVHHLPVSTGKLQEAHERIARDQIRIGDALLYMQDYYLQLITPENSQSLAEALAMMRDSTNFPMLVQCSLGKDRTGFLIAMLLSILEVPEETILKDYVRSNESIRFELLAPLVQHFSMDAQEAVTALLSANEDFLLLALETIRKEYGSIATYQHLVLHIDEKARREIQANLLEH